jgi:hypothetical protein
MSSYDEAWRNAHIEEFIKEIIEAGGKGSPLMASPCP